MDPCSSSSTSSSSLGRRFFLLSPINKKIQTIDGNWDHENTKRLGTSEVPTYLSYTYLGTIGHLHYIATPFTNKREEDLLERARTCAENKSLLPLGTCPDQSTNTIAPTFRVARFTFDILEVRSIAASFVVKKWYRANFITNKYATKKSDAEKTRGAERM